MNREELTINIGMNIRKYRLDADLSQESLSFSANLSQAYIGKLERGERCPNIETLYKISEVLNVPVGNLLDFDKKPKCESETKIKRLSQKQLNILAQVMDILSENNE